MMMLLRLLIRISVGCVSLSPLHSSPFYTSKNDGRVLLNCDLFANALVRLQLFYELESEQMNNIIRLIKLFFEKL